MKTINDNIKTILAIMIIFFTYCILILLIFLCLGDKEIISQILIAVVSGFTGVLGYYFGYSQGASKKDEAQALLTANSMVTQTTISPDPGKQ